MDKTTRFQVDKTTEKFLSSQTNLTVPKISFLKNRSGQIIQVFNPFIFLFWFTKVFIFLNIDKFRSSHRILIFSKKYCRMLCSAIFRFFKAFLVIFSNGQNDTFSGGQNDKKNCVVLDAYGSTQYMYIAYIIQGVPFYDITLEKLLINGCSNKFIYF